VSDAGFLFENCALCWSPCGTVSERRVLEGGGRGALGSFMVSFIYGRLHTKSGH
jgi:hypothetical protein